VADEAFHQELARLRAAAGGWSYEVVLRRLSEQTPPVVLSRQTLSDWFTGKVRLPRDRKVKTDSPSCWRPRQRSDTRTTSAIPSTGGVNEGATGAQRPSSMGQLADW
jgi:hypothetical protein